MLEYPSIPGVSKCLGLGKPCLAFYKYDGSNIRFEWSRKRSWHKFGTRTQLIDTTTDIFSDAIVLFKEHMADEIESIVRKEFGKGIRKIVAFAEFFGPSSFAGTHSQNEPKELKFFDVAVEDKGLISARQFLNLFALKPWSAQLVYSGNLNQQFITAVRDGQYPLNEGVVCKGKGWSAKIKTLAYLERLKARFADDWVKYAE